MKLIYLALLLLIVSIGAKAQNLVTNGDFEDYTTCPTALGQITNATGWSNYTSYNSDYYNVCGSAVVGVPGNFNGSEYAASGNAYAGIRHDGANTFVESNSYITTSISSMTAGNLYEVSLSASLADSCALRASVFSMGFYKDRPTFVSTTGVPVTFDATFPQLNWGYADRISSGNGWQRIKKKFLADSAYNHLLIGVPNSIWDYNFGPGTQLYTHIYIDSIVITEAKEVVIGNIDLSLCEGETIQVPFTVYGSNYLHTGNIFTLQLSDATGSFSSAVDIGTLTGTTSGIINGTLPAGTTGSAYRLRIITSNSADTSENNGANIAIFTNPVITASSNSPLCEGGSTLNLSATTVTGANYEWNGPTSFYSNAQNPVITPVAPAQSGAYIVSATKNNCTSYDTVTVNINPNPNVTITNNNTVCPGTTFQLSATALAGSVFSWTGPGTFTSNIANPSWANAAYSDAGLYTVVASLNGCSDTADITMSVQITTATPVASSNSPVCEGFPLNLTALSATPGVTYNWSGPSGYTSTQQNPTQTSNTNHNGDFIVKATVNGCVSLPDTVHVQVLPKPYLGNYASPNDTVCEGTVVTFVTVPMSGVTNPTFQWFKNNMPVAGATNLRLVSPYATGDTFYCRTYCQNQCGDNLTLYSNKVGMTVMPIVTDLSVTLSSVPAPALPGNPVTFTATVLGGGYSPGYQWKKNGVAINNAIYAIYSANNLSPYDEIVCCVVSSDPCAVPTTACSDAMVINFPASVGEVSNDDIFQLYPNPNDGSFKVKIQKSKVKKIEVVNVSGQVVYQTKPETAQAEYTINLPSQLPSGTYMLRVYDGVQYYRQSFTVSK